MLKWVARCANCRRFAAEHNQSSNHDGNSVADVPSTLLRTPYVPSPQERFQILFTRARICGALDGPSAETAVRARLFRVLAAEARVATETAAAHEALAERLGAALASIVNNIDGEQDSRALRDEAEQFAETIDRSAAEKTAALEKEAVSLESALEQAALTFATACAVATAGADFSPVAVESACQTLDSLIRSMSPAGPLESLLDICIAPDSPTRLGCRLSAPRALSVSDVSLSAPAFRARLCAN